MKVLGILLVVFGVIALVYGGFTYTKREKVIDGLTPMHLKPLASRTAMNVLNNESSPLRKARANFGSDESVTQSKRSEETFGRDPTPPAITTCEILLALSPLTSRPISTDLM